MAAMADGPQIESVPITKRNVLDKICFVRLGVGFQSGAERLNRDLLDYHQEHRGGLISRQTISYWFSKNSAPSRADAYTFLAEYISSRINYDSLNVDQKKVYARIDSFLRHNITTSSDKNDKKLNSRVYKNNNNSLVIRVNDEKDDRAKSDSIVGIYVMFRIRLSESKIDPIAREIIKITRIHRQILFENWYLHDDSELSKFEGSVIKCGDMLWCFASSTVGVERLRAFTFKESHTNSPIFTNFRWGIMTSNVSLPSSKDPASCRVLLCKYSSKIDDFHAFITNNVRFLSRDDLLNNNGEVIWRLIDNNTSAHSIYGTAKPAIDESGAYIVDMTLKANQQTIEHAFDELKEFKL